MAVPKLSLCIPTINRWNKFLKDSIPKYLENPYINEIVICDENGNDVIDIMTAYPDHPKLILHINDSRLGAHLNKNKVVSLAKNDWIALIDSDNFAPTNEYFGAWAEFIGDGIPDPNFVYCPGKSIVAEGYHDLNFTTYSGFALNKHNWKQVHHNPVFDVLTNNGNFIVNKQSYLASTDSYYKEIMEMNNAWECKLKTALMLDYGLNFIIVGKMQWYHARHPDSLYMETLKELEKVREPIMNIYECFCCL